MKQKDLLFLLISSALLSIVWIVFSIIHINLTSTVSKTVIQQITPINGTFDEQTIQSLQGRLQISPVLSIQATDITPTPTQIPLATPTSPVATPSESLTPSPSITQEVSPSP